MKKREFNPFRPGNGLMPPYLAGRDTELNNFKRTLKIALSLPQNLVISGLRGIGKTVLLAEFETICREDKWLPIRREFNPRLCDTGQFLFAIISDLIMKTQGVSISGKAKRQKIGFLPDEEVINGNYIEKLLSSYSGTLEDRFEALLADTFSEVVKAGFKGIVFLYDKFHSIEDEKIERQFPISILLETFSHLQQKGMRYYLVLSGLPSLFPNLVRAKTYAERMFNVEKIESLCKEESALAIKKPLCRVKFTFEDKLVDTLVKETAGYPYFLQFYSFHLIENIPKQRISYDDFLKIRPFILNHLDESFFAGRFERTSNSEREVLFKMIDIHGGMNVFKLRKQVKKSRGALNLILTSLMDKDIIYRVRRGAYSFTLPLFREFLKRQVV